jgi:hypothetical protein
MSSIPRRTLAMVAAVVLCCAIAPATDAVQAKPTGKLQQAEEQARTKAAAEIVSVARFAISVNAVQEARATFATALTLAPRDEKTRKELADLLKRKKKDSPTKESLAQIDERRTKALAKAGELLAPAVAAYADADRSDDLARLVASMSSSGIPLDAIVAQHDLVWFEPFLDWRSKKDIEKLGGGWEYVDGAWCDPERVKALNASHATWAKAWVIGDDVHEVRTAMPFRTGRQVLATVAAFRGFVLGYFAGEVDLRAPSVKLPILLTATHAEMVERINADGGGAPDAAALYHAGPKIGNPCYVSFEVKGQNGLVATDLAGTRFTLLHEATHQILFEFSKHSADSKRDPKQASWLVEGIAEFLPNYVLRNGVWAIDRRKDRPVMKGIVAEGGRGWCHDHAGHTTPIETFVTLPDMASVDDYHLAEGLALFLLEGSDRAYRSRYSQLVETVHQVKSGPQSFAECFKGVDLKTLESEFAAFCSALTFDSK